MPERENFLKEMRRQEILKRLGELDKQEIKGDIKEGSPMNEKAKLERELAELDDIPFNPEK